MSEARPPEAKPLYVDRQTILKALEESNAAMGFVPVPGATAQGAREMMAAQGIRAEDNFASREMIALRYPNDGRHGEREETTMRDETLPEAKPLYADRQAALKSLGQAYAEIGFVPDYAGTIENLHRQMIAEGVRPEQNGASREMITQRYPGENL